MKTYQLTATALPSCLLYPLEAEQVKKITVTIEECPIEKQGGKR